MAECEAFIGPIFYLNTIGGHLFVINSQEVAAEILEKNANAYAARPGNMVMATDLYVPLRIRSKPITTLY